MTGPFHYDLWWDAAGEGEADEGAAAGVGADEVALGVGFLHPLSATVADLDDGRIESYLPLGGDESVKFRKYQVSRFSRIMQGGEPVTENPL